MESSAAISTTAVDRIYLSGLFAATYKVDHLPKTTGGPRRHRASGPKRELTAYQKLDAKHRTGDISFRSVERCTRQ